MLDRGLTRIANEGGRAHGLLNVTPHDFFALKISVPANDEQTKIASCLSEVYKEIDQLNNKRKAIEKQKKGLMQVLLTGKVRVQL